MSPPHILLLIPHPDDEVVCAALAIRRAIAAGSRVLGLYLTTGVPDREVLWPWQRRGHVRLVAQRHAEAVAAATALGLEPVHFSDWPTRRLKDHLVAADALIARTLAEHAVDALWVPAWEGAHQDHDVANFLAARHAARLPVTEFAAYSYAGGRVASQQFATTSGEEVTMLSPAEQRWKRDLLALYHSERGNLRHIGITQESRHSLTIHDYARPPHDGCLFYQRFQWVPFRHPRIDFDRPEAICAALTASPLFPRDQAATRRSA
jgi:N-acetylglucosamine malate deacetylase 1